LQPQLVLSQTLQIELLVAQLRAATLLLEQTLSLQSVILLP
jgi:hypothetical protein